MKKKITNRIEYNPNGRVKITVQNMPVYDDDTNELRGYKRVSTLRFEDYKAEELKFADSDEIAEYFGNIDFDDPQLSLLSKIEINDKGVEVK